MHWENLKGYTLTKNEEKSTWWKAIYDFKLDSKAPLTLVDDDGHRITPEPRYLTDMGSIPRWPPILQCLIPKDRFLAFLPHDSSYEFGGLYIDGVFTRLTRFECDQLLLRGCLCDPIPAWRATCEIVFQQVRLFGAGNFDQRTDVPPDAPAGLNHQGPMPELKTV